MLLAWASLFWMTFEGAIGLLAGLEANSISVLTWAASSAVEGLDAQPRKRCRDGRCNS